jgi:hypothetical protein
MMDLDPLTLAGLLDGDARRTACPSSETLALAASPRADRQLRERVVDHVLACARCAEELRLAQEIVAWADAATAANDGRSRMVPWPYAAAAALAFVAVALGAQLLFLQRDRRPEAASPNSSPRAEQQLAQAERSLAELQQRLRDAESPEINAPIIELAPMDRTRGKAAPQALPGIRASARQIVFVLNTSNPTPGTSHDVEIAAADDRVVWRGTGLRQSPGGTLTLVVPRPLLGPDSRIRLYAPRSRMVLDQYLVPQFQSP